MDAESPRAENVSRLERWKRVLFTELLATVVGGLGLWLFPGPDAGLTWRGRSALLVFFWLFQFMALLALAPARPLARLGGVAGKVAPSIYAAGLAAVGLWPVARAVTSGAWIREQRYAGALFAGLVIGGAVVAAACAYAWFGAKRYLPRAALAASLAFALLLGFINQHYFPGLYVEVHLCLFVVAALLAQQPLGELIRRGLATRPGLTHIVFGLTHAAFVGMLFLFHQIYRLDHLTVTQLLLKSPRAHDVLTQFMAPGPSNEIYSTLATLDAHTPAPVTAAKPPEFSLPADWNVVLITVDALRADTLPPDRDVYPKKRFTEGDTPFLSSLARRSYRFTRAYAGATFTNLSMPSMFHSRWAWEDGTRGIPLPVLMAQHGRYPVAVVNDFFMEPWDPGLRAMLDGFAEVDVYSKLAQNEQRPRLDAMLSKVAKRPFFLWTHYYAVHSPGWAGGPMPRNDSAWPANYRRGVRWVDGQVKSLMDTLTRLGLAQKTIVIVTSDHGEGLMDNGDLWHGPNVYEEASRVPLFIHIPNKDGALIDRTVGNIDLPPTLLALLGGAPTAAHRGDNLMPLLADPTIPWDVPYLLMSSHGEQVGVVRGTQKRVIDLKTGVHFHFDLRTDPLEEHDILDDRSLPQHQLVADLTAMDPDAFAAGLTDTETSSLLDRRMAEVRPDAPPASLPFLLSLVRLAPTKRRIEWALSIFDAAPTDDTRLRVMEALATVAQEKVQGRALSYLKTITDPDRLRAFVGGMADLSPAPFATDWFAAGLAKAAAEDRTHWLPWLRLVAPWPMATASHAQALVRMLETLGAAPGPNDAVLERLLLGAVAHLPTVDGATTAALLPEVTRRLDSPNAATVAAACVAAGHLGDRSVEPALRARLAGGPFLVRIGALEGLAALLGPAAIPELDALGRDRTFTFAVVGLLRGMGRPEGLPFLDWAAKNATNERARDEAVRVAAEIRVRAAR